ncbi:hypothetical protein A7U60_g4160 [Sanghuangporus baumii]|uniref:DUF6534 domain-containing protein n=1 Tax=Sanghuangporus baumii TaxID=108892 RepID=A0A9Q5HZB3_SANBA|nr:hypothetical protein A7U60_g4160 [Sanghuangporus baumii]
MLARRLFSSGNLFNVNSRVDKDKRWIKPYTSAIWILDTLHQGFFIESMYKYFISNYGNILYLVHIDKVIIYMGMGAAVIDAMVQCVFVLRAWKLSNENRILTGALIIAVLGQLGVTLAYAGQAAGFRYVPQLFATVRTERAMNAVWVITDTFIAVVLVYILWKRGLGLKRTDSVLNRLILYSVGTGLVTGVVGVAAFIGSELLPESLIYMFSDLILPKLYLNCLLASLNARVGLRKRLEGDAGCTSIHFTDPPAIEASHPVMAENSQVGSLPSPRAIECQIDIDIDTDNHPEPGQQRRNSVYTETDPTEIGTRDSESRSLEQ